MKKIISIALAAIMLVALAVPAFAEAATLGNNTHGVVVNVTETPTSGGDSTVYKLDIDWGTLTFTYSGSWDAERLEYNNGNWNTSDPAEITVTNSSNASVDVDAYFDTLGTTAKTTQGVTATLENTDFSLASAAVAGSATSDVIKVHISGLPKSNSFEVGTVTVAISAPGNNG